MRSFPRNDVLDKWALPPLRAVLVAEKRPSRRYSQARVALTVRSRTGGAKRGQRPISHADVPCPASRNQPQLGPTPQFQPKYANDRVHSLQTCPLVIRGFVSLNLLRLQPKFRCQFLLAQASGDAGLNQGFRQLFDRFQREAAALAGPQGFLFAYLAAQVFQLAP